MFREVNRFLTDTGVDHWIAFGTLLGWYRHGGLIPGDLDVDFGVLERDYEAVWRERHRLPAGFRMHDTSHRHRGPKLYVSWRGWDADIYVYGEQGDMLQSYVKSTWGGEITPFPRCHILPRREVTLLGQSTWVPAQTEAWLRHTYGYIGENGRQDPRTGYWHPPPSP